MNKSLILVLTAFVPLAAADEVKLKDGTVYKNCTVEVETPESVSLLVPVSGGIKDSVTVKRDLIESIRKATPDELEAARIGKMYAKPETMNAGDLEKALADLDKTIKKNPQGLAHDAAVSQSSGFAGGEEVDGGSPGRPECQGGGGSDRAHQIRL